MARNVMEGRWWPTSKAYRALGQPVPIDVLETDIANGLEPIERLWQWEVVA